jgi:hypothetical protein
MPRRSLVLMAVAALAGCGGATGPELHGAPTTPPAVTVQATATAGTAGPTATAPYATNPPHTIGPPQPTRPPTPSQVTTTRTSPTPSSVNTSPTWPKIVSWTILYNGHELTDFVLNDHGVPACVQVSWQLKYVVSPGDVPFRLSIELDGQVIYAHQVPDGTPDPLVRTVPIQLRDGPFDISAGLHLEFAGRSDNRYVHFVCRAA